MKRQKRQRELISAIRLMGRKVASKSFFFQCSMKTGLATFHSFYKKVNDIREHLRFRFSFWLPKMKYHNHRHTNLHTHVTLLFTFLSSMSLNGSIWMTTKNELNWHECEHFRSFFLFFICYKFTFRLWFILEIHFMRSHWKKCKARNRNNKKKPARTQIIILWKKTKMENEEKPPVQQRKIELTTKG